MKTAVVHDWLVSLGGAERVVQEILNIYPSPLYTLFQTSSPILESLFSPYLVRSSFLQHAPFVGKHYRNYLPLFPMAIERFDLSEFDLIISSSHAVAKGIKKHSNQFHVCYCHTPMRYLWDLEEDYLHAMGSIKSAVAKQVFKYLRKWDLKTAGNVDLFIANSAFVQKRIKRVYGRESTVIYPPIATHLMTPNPYKESFYLTVSRLVPYKKIDIIIEAFNQMPSCPLKIIGQGPEMERLVKLAKPHIELLGFQPDEKVREYYSRAKGFVFAAEEDFGIVPLEAQASATPVIAYKAGGSLETIEEGKTGLFFSQQTSEQLIYAIKDFEKIKWDYEYIRAHSEKFSTECFHSQFKKLVEKQWEIFCENRHSCRG